MTKIAQWPQFGYNPGHSADNPLETLVNTGNVSTLKVAWNNGTIVQPNGIVVDRNDAYVTDLGQSNAGLFALDITTGAQKWYANVDFNSNLNPDIAAVAGNVVVSACGSGPSNNYITGLCGFNAYSGKVLWTNYCTEYMGSPCAGLRNHGTSPTLYNSLIYFQSTNGINEQPDTEALDPKTGTTVWDVGGVYHCPDAGQANGNPLPAADGLVFAVLGCGGPQGATELCALSASSGSSVWCDPSTPYVEDLIAGNGKLYFVEPGASNNNVVIAVDAKTGAQFWTASLPGSNVLTMAITDKRLIVEDGSAGVFALNANTGRALWNYTANGNLYQSGALSVANGVVYTDGGGGNNGNVAIAAFNEANGALVWTSGSIGNGSAPATPVILNGTVYAGCYTMCAFTLQPSNNSRGH